MVGEGGVEGALYLFQLQILPLKRCPISLPLYCSIFVSSGGEVLLYLSEERVAAS